MPVSSIESKAISDIVLDDIYSLIDFSVAEGVNLEFKEDLPVEKGNINTWRNPKNNNREIHENSSVEIAREISAFANAYGGTCIIGISETDKVAVAKNPVPDCQELASKLEQSIRSRIDPPLARLDVAAVLESNCADGSGYVILRVGPSHRRPHIVGVTKGRIIAPFRKGSESAAMKAIEIQDLTLRAYSESDRVSNRLSALGYNTIDRSEARERRVSKHYVQPPTFSVHAVATPLERLSIRRIASEATVDLKRQQLNIERDNYLDNVTFGYILSEFRPQFRSRYSVYDSSNFTTKAAVYEDGTCSITLDIFGTAETRAQHITLTETIGLISAIQDWVNIIRFNTGTPEVPFACSMEIFAHVPLHQAWSEQRLSPSCAIRKGLHTIPTFLLTDRSGSYVIMRQIIEDMYNIAGVDLNADNCSFVHGQTF